MTTNVEKRVVQSTQESSCDYLRKCRLAAAPRICSFDDVEEGDTINFDQALCMLLHTKSLVGPFDERFFAEWLGIVYPI